MTAAGWTVMLISVSVVATVLGVCIYRVLTAPPTGTDHMAGSDLHTPDMDEP